MLINAGTKKECEGKQDELDGDEDHNVSKQGECSKQGNVCT